MNADYYNDKSVGYGISRTRLKRILALAGNVQGKRILDIGCSTGYLGESLKKFGAAYVAGVEISDPAAQEARQKLDNVYVFNIQDAVWPEAVMVERFDLIVMAEVLEHVFDPAQVLQKIHKLLAPEGAVIITTPNFMLWTNRIKFLFGKFKYENQGMFDFGHIRFFTYPYLKQVLRDSGFTLEGERNIIFPGKATNFLKRWPGLFAFQFIVKARKKT